MLDTATRKRFLENVALSASEYELVFEELKRRYFQVCDDEVVVRSISQYVEGAYALDLLEIVGNDAHPGAKVLDVGSGFGNFVNLMQLTGANCIGIEPSPLEVSIARLHSSRLFPNEDGPTFFGGTFQDADVTPNGFDVVTLWNVLEHVSDLEGILNFARDAVFSEGCVYLICPNYFSWGVEPHYQVPWNPIRGLSRQMARNYITKKGKNPHFFDESLFLRRNFEVLRCARDLGFVVEQDSPHGTRRSPVGSLLQRLRLTIPIKRTVFLRLRPGTSPRFRRK